MFSMYTNNGHITIFELMVLSDIKGKIVSSPELLGECANISQSMECLTSCGVFEKRVHANCLECLWCTKLNY